MKLDLSHNILCIFANILIQIALIMVVFNEGYHYFFCNIKVWILSLVSGGLHDKATTILLIPFCHNICSLLYHFLEHLLLRQHSYSILPRVNLMIVLLIAMKKSVQMTKARTFQMLPCLVSKLLWCQKVSIYGSVSPGREFWPFQGNFLKKVNARCAKTKRGSLFFSTVPENLGLVHHKNVTVNSIALVKLVHNNP